MYKQFILVTISALALTFGSANAQANDIDRDKSGSISKDEFYGHVNTAGLYDDWDRDDDGFIEENEFTDIGFEEGFGTFNDWDLNDDQRLDANEFYESAYNSYDTDEDGKWDAGEWDDAGDDGFFDL